MGYLSSEQCEQILEVTYGPDLPARGPGSDWKYNPGIWWVAPNGTQWPCGSNLWPWLPVGWVGYWTLGFALAHGSIKPSLQQALVNLPYLHARWARSVMIKIKALTNFTKRPSWTMQRQSKTTRMAMIQNRMALDWLTATQGGTCAIIKIECCVYILDLSGNISATLDDMKNQVKAVSNDNPPF